MDLSGAIEITKGHRPVVEKILKHVPLVPDDTHMDNRNDMVAVITGPNMAGRSIYMRQVVLIMFMTQTGSFVPARFAHIGIVGRVFTHIDANDGPSVGQSTFMAEVTEVTELLKNVTARNLLILDEISRGTSTYGGISIVRAVLEFCVDKERLGAKTLLATHYYELTALEG